MKLALYFKKFKPGEDFKKFVQNKIEKLSKFLHGESKKEALFKVEIEKTEEAEPKKGLFKTEIHYQPIGEKAVHISFQSRNLKTSFTQALHKLKQNLSKLHRKFHKKNK